MKNREIKFRMWNAVKNDPSRSRYFYETEPAIECLKQQINFSVNRHPNYDHIADGCAFEQFTGLKDKNGKEIYEGDIIKRITVFDDGGADVHIGILTFNDLEAHYYLHSINNELSRSFGKAGKNTTYEVIGNIHENHELLTK